MDAAFLALLVIVAVALAFDYTNGFHDAANAIAVAVSTKALTPRVALALAAVMNLVGALISTKVAKTVGEGIIDAPQGSAGLQIVFAALIGAITWNLITWYFGLPSSSSHALIGGLVGAALAASHSVQWMGILDKVVIPMVLSPLVGFGLGYLFMLAILWAFRNANVSKANRGFRYAQIVSSGTMALGHGMQDAQKTMGIITLALFTAGEIDTFEVPTVGHPRRRPGDQRRDVLRRLPDHADARTADHPAHACGRLLRPDRGLGRHDHDGHRVRRPGVDDAHHDHLDHGRGGDAATVGGPLGRRRQYRARVGRHAAGRRRGRRGGLLPHPPHRRLTPA